MMEGIKIFCAIIIIICGTIAQDDDDSDIENSSESGRELRQYSQEWRTVKYFQHQEGWIPQDTPAEPSPPKRRRIRKRKRRPQIDSSPENDESSKPFRLDQIKESWEEMGEENVAQKPHTRRKSTPNYQDGDDFEETNFERKEKIRDPFTALQEAETKQRNKPENNTPNLKTLLKQSGGGLSLSEILQQKNLSLSELLRGNQQAISALTERNSEMEEPSTQTPNEVSKYKRLPPSVGLRKNLHNSNSNLDDNPEVLTSRETLEAQRKRLAILHGHKENKIYSDLKKLDVINEPATEKRIFVPSHPKFYTSLDYKPDFNQNESLDNNHFDYTTTPIPQSTTKKIWVSTRTPFKPKLKGHLPITSAKLNKFTTKESILEENYPKLPPKAIKIDVNQLLGLAKINEFSQIEDGPLKMSFDLPQIKTKTSLVVTTRPEGEKLKHVTAKEEIMEILKDPNTRDYLSKILETRNMTVEELVEQRERGSSQLHLADIFHNKTREPEPKDEPFIGQMNQEFFDNFPIFQRQPKSREFTPEESTKTKSDLRSLYTVTSFPTYKIEMAKAENEENVPIWKQLLFPNFFQNNQDKTNNLKILEAKVTPTTSTTIIPDIETLQRLEEIENQLAESSHHRLDIDLGLNQNNYEEEGVVLPNGVKSAIIASSAIIGSSILVFLTIFMIFKWSQKQRQNRLNYNGSFSGSKIKSPILENNPRRTLRSFMAETLGRKRNNYYKSHLQSMSDSIWDSERSKPYI